MNNKWLIFKNCKHSKDWHNSANIVKKSCPRFGEEFDDMNRSVVSYIICQHCKCFKI